MAEFQPIQQGASVLHLSRIELSHQGQGLLFLLDWNLRTHVPGSVHFLTMKRQLIQSPYAQL